MPVHRIAPASLFLAGVLGLTSLSPVTVEAADPVCPDCQRVVSRVLELLPRKPREVVVIDLNDQPRAIRQQFDGVEGFVRDGDDRIFLTKQGSSFQNALRGAGIWDYALAITVWHEMAHLAGADEAAAQRQEEQLWSEFVVSRKVDASRGLAYLRLLRNRRANDRLPKPSN